ncbi:MAG: His-Xaa-Ser system radical SAM maturase HxsB [Candidatus Altiarchaeota archaeon]
MPISYFPQTINEEYTINKYNYFKFGKDKNLITTDHGAWCLLDDSEYRALRTLNVHKDPNLFNFLKEKGIVITEESFDSVVESYRDRFHFLFRGPTLHIIVPTFRCNMRCIYCHSIPKAPKTKGFDMDKDTAKKIVDFILTSPSKLLAIEFQGGDCLLNFDIVKFVIDYGKEQAIKKNKKLKFSLVTNLTLMDEEKLKFLKDEHIMGLATSLDGPKKVHDKNRQYLNGSGSYDDVVYWIKRIKTEFEYDFNLRALTTITKFSLQYPKEIVDEFVNLGFNSVWFRPLNNLGFANLKFKEISYSPEEFIKFWNSGLEYIIKLNSSGKLFQEILTRYLLMKILNRYDPMMVDIQSPCGAGIGQLLYDNKGNIFTCDEAKVLGEAFMLGNVFENTLYDVMHNPTVYSMVSISSKLSTLCDACAWSPYCGICPVDIYVSQRTIVPKLAESMRCKIFKSIIEEIFRMLLFSEKERSIFLNWVSSQL